MDTEALHNLLNDLPIDIDTLAALVEGDLGCQEADAVREQLLAADPELATQVEMMARDRVMLRTLGDEQPPAGLAESVIARLEREALLGLAQGDPLTDSLPISSVRVVRPSRVAGVARWMISPAGAGLALAAMVVLAIGIGLQFLPSGSGSGSSPLPGPIAENDRNLDERTIASGDSATTPVVAADVPDAPGDERTERILAESQTSAEPDPAMLFTNDWDRALALLAEGRLLVRVQSFDPETTIAQLGRFTDRAARPGEAWRLGTDVATPIAVAMEAKFAPMVMETEPTQFAASDMPEAGRDARSLRNAKVSPPSVLEAIYIADTRLDRAAMASLRSALSLGDGQVAVFEEFALPMDLPRVLTPDAVLWWGRPASEWSERVFVPIVVERIKK